MLWSFDISNLKIVCKLASEKNKYGDEIMKKILKLLLLGFAFTTATIFMGCSDAISENESESLTENVETAEFGRHCFGGHHGRTGGNSISDNSSNHRHNGHGHGSSVCK